jgi:DNA-binding XRE family transcriptional regulator
MIYFVQSNDHVKIGYAINPKYRIRSIQTSHPFKLYPLLVLDGTLIDETKLHDQFQQYRVNGEWFTLCEEIQTFINEHLDLDKRNEFDLLPNNKTFTENEQIKRLRHEHKLNLRQLGEKLNITAQSVKEIEEREQSGALTLSSCQKVAKVLGYKFEYRFVKTE